MKTIVLGFVRALSLPYRLIPERLRHATLLGLFVLEGRAGNPRVGLRHLFSLWDKLDLAISERAMALDGGQHPKHRLTGYHTFFTRNLSGDARVLDVGCGYGAVAASIARAGPDRRVTGIDIDSKNIARAVAQHSQPNLSFAEADATKNLPPGPWDAVVLSNILEHIDDRHQFLRDIVEGASPDQILIRVPLFERHWHLPLRAELGVSYVSDPDHKIEHRLSEFVDEVTSAGLSIIELQTIWGEIWCACAVKSGRQANVPHAA